MAEACPPAIDVNVLVHGAPGAPLGDAWRALLGAAGAAPPREPMTWGAEPRTLTVARGDGFCVVDLALPGNANKADQVIEFVAEAVRFVGHGARKIVVLEHVERLCRPPHAQALRVLLERFSHVAAFVGTTHRFGALDAAVRSRFALRRVPLPRDARRGTWWAPVAETLLLPKPLPSDAGQLREAAYDLFEAGVAPAALARALLASRRAGARTTALVGELAGVEARVAAGAGGAPARLVALEAMLAAARDK